MLVALSEVVWLIANSNDLSTIHLIRLRLWRPTVQKLWHNAMAGAQVTAANTSGRCVAVRIMIASVNKVGMLMAAVQGPVILHWAAHAGKAAVKGGASLAHRLYGRFLLCCCSAICT